MIDLTSLSFRSAAPRVLDFGGVLTPGTGGPRQRIDRIGTRSGFDLETAAMLVEPDGRLWSIRLSRAKTEGALIRILEPGLVLNAAEGTPVARASTAGGSAFLLGGATAGLVIPEGKWVSHIHDGRRYAYRVAASVTVNGAGEANLTLWPMLRAVVTAGDVLEIAVPKMQASSISGDFGYANGPGRTVAFSFTLEEDE